MKLYHNEGAPSPKWASKVFNLIGRQGAHSMIAPSNFQTVNKKYFLHTIVLQQKKNHGFCKKKIFFFIVYYLITSVQNQALLPLGPLKVRMSHRRVMSHVKSPSSLFFCVTPTIYSCKMSWKVDSNVA